MARFRLSLIKLILVCTLSVCFIPSAKAQVGVLPSANQQATPWVRLNWTANGAGDNVTGYNVYRSTTNGSGYVKQTVTPVPNIYFRDDNVTHGTTYYYVLTAVNITGESADSTQVSATP